EDHRGWWAVHVVTDDLLLAANTARDQAPAPGDVRYDSYCTELAGGLDSGWDAVLEANAQDLADARTRGLSDTLLDRLRLAERHLAPLVKLAERVRTALPEVTRPSEPVAAAEGMTVCRRPKPLGVLLMIYEARPTVTVEGALLPVAVGNVVLLRGGSEMAATNARLGEIAAEAAAT